jgi:hypothetical protein
MISDPVFGGGSTMCLEVSQHGIISSFEAKATSSQCDDNSSFYPSLISVPSIYNYGVDITTKDFACQKTAPPDCSLVILNVSTIWPPNQNFVSVSLLGIDDAQIIITSVYQSEPLTETGNEYSYTCPDAEILSNNTVALRAERLTTNGRIYQINFTVTDFWENTCSDSLSLCVPYEQYMVAQTPTSTSTCTTNDDDDQDGNKRKKNDENQTCTSTTETVSLVAYTCTPSGQWYDSTKCPNKCENCCPDQQE